MSNNKLLFSIHSLAQIDVVNGNIISFRFLEFQFIGKIRDDKNVTTIQLLKHMDLERVIVINNALDLQIFFRNKKFIQI